MLRKYGLSIMAAAVALAAAAFTRPGNEGNFQGSVTFHYTNTSDYSDDAVMDKANWSSTASPQECEGDADLACRLVVSQSVATQISGVWYLNDNITVTPGAAGSGTGYVPSTSTAGYISKVDREN
jgi:hypothetical protein